MNADHPKLSIARILKWADDHVRRHQRWPNEKSGRANPGDPHPITWRRIDYSLRHGTRGLPRGPGLAKLLEQARGKPLYFFRARLSNRQILDLARAHYKRTGNWPNKTMGAIAGAPGRTWSAVNATLVSYGDETGRRISLADLLAEAYGKRNPRKLPPLSVATVLAWADRHHRRTGVWPTRKKSGPVRDAPGETWPALDASLRRGGRSLPACGGLAAFLDQHRNVRNKADQPRITQKQILQWCDAHFRRTGQWPTAESGSVEGVPNEKWMAIHDALRLNRRGLRTGCTLAQFLIKHRGKRNVRHPPRLSLSIILRWADSHYERTGDWPSPGTGRVVEEPDENWNRINEVLRTGERGLPGRSSLANLLASRRPRLYAHKGIPLQRAEILKWAACHHELTGALPSRKSGPVRGVPGETWCALDAALRSGSRSLRGRSSLKDLLTAYVPPYRSCGRRLSVGLILRWADSFFKRVGYWPTRHSAYTDRRRREKWAVIDQALREGLRGLPGRSSLAKLLKKHRGVARSTQGEYLPNLRAQRRSLGPRRRRR